ncbi:MAG: hypothetical protein IJ691_04890 [Lachnospiraceae bacterium]|nr:hypothetical protein [Lachnospiraceae bacterium]
MGYYYGTKKITEMTDREYAIFKKRREAYYIRRKFLLSVAATILMIFVLSLAIKGFASNASNADKEQKCKYFKTIMLEYGKTLDDIAEEYYDPAYFTSAESVKKEIMEVNHINEYSAIPGGYIIYVPYYSDIH